ncbi:MAG: thiamine pyrophosphate-dependent enzyme, partial [Rhizomicrobium sp.]
HWMASRYNTPFLTLILNNRGWKAPKMSALSQYPQGYASRSNDLDVAFDPPPDYGAIATAAGGAFARTVKDPGDVELALAEAVRVVRDERRCAVIDAWLAHL